MTSPPVKYVRQANYTDFSTQHPTDQQSGTSLDADFGAILTSNNAIIDRLAQIQRSDGALLNAVVTPDSLSASTLALMSATGTIRGAWLTGTAYALKDIITQTGLSYMCAVPHTSGVFATDLAAVKWVLLAGGVLPFVIDGINGRAGINMAPANVFDITSLASVNAPVIAQINTVHAGNAVRADFRANNGTSTLILGLFGTGFTPAGVSRAGGALIISDGPGGLTLATGANQPVYVAVNNVQVAQFAATGPTFNGLTAFGTKGRAISQTGQPAAGGTIDMDTGAGANGWSGLLIVSNSSVANASNRVVKFYFVAARGAVNAFTLLGTDTQGAGCNFSLSVPSAGVIRATNNDAGQSEVDMSYFWNFAF